ncbi:MAG: type VII secretion protein EssC [Oscillospiraceae bacterium]|nr:type VII secretion protein EssC [Oscillospiraceae bacterium]
MESLLIFSNGSYHESPVTGSFHLNRQMIPSSRNVEYTCQKTSEGLKINDSLLQPYTPCQIGGRTVYWFLGKRRLYRFPEQGRIYVGNKDYADIITNHDLFCTIEPETLHLECGEAYVNGKLVKQNRTALSAGDCIFIGGMKITVRENDIVTDGDIDSNGIYLDYLGEIAKPFEGFPVYKRSPRIIKRIPTDTVKLTDPPAKPEKQKGQLLKLIVPPLVMLIMTIVVMIFIPRGIYALIGIATTLTSTVMTVTNYFQEKKDAKETEAARQENYEAYLLRQRKTLYKLKKEQEASLTYHYPALSEISAMTRGYSSRIYERNANDDDFLTVAIGSSSHPCSYTVSRGSEEIQAKEDPLLTEAREIADAFSRTGMLPTVIDLKKAHLGIVGEKHNVHEQLMVILTQIAFFQSYHDVEIICLFDSKFRNEFSWLSWYPHFKIKAINVTGVIDGENVRDQVLGNLTQILKQRKLKKEEQKKESVFLPHYVFVIDEPKLVINHSIMEYLQEKDSGIGFSIIYTTDMMASLPENIKTVVQLGDAENAVLSLNEGKLRNLSVSLQRTENINLEAMSRCLAALTHVQGVSTQIPESITFFEMYHIQHPGELDVTARWSAGNSHKSLAVPLGVRAKDDFVDLNLHEKAHGPHGLVAGTTGSGKSEIIQSYILSLAVNFHPYEVGFLLIDYKGGGMAGLFKDLPHLLGMITNLDGSESMRAMASIKSELSRRQKVFGEYNVNHINQYNKLFKKGEAKDPLPHLFLISDEFAELKKEQPDFMSELVSAARIGRSLGIHLILATQKPTGVVDDQIWSNSKFKLALKVQDASDSNEVLKTPDAANITLPGRAYLQVGNNEIYELFQSAWSGASYNKNQEGADYDDRVYIINKLGQRQVLGHDLSGGDVEESRLTQLDAVVSYISGIYKSMDVKPVGKPWHPPLEKNIASKFSKSVADVSIFTEINADVPLGMIDIPEQQRQEEFIYNFVKNGNLAVFASSGFGKSVTLMTIILTLALKNSPQLLKFYIIDLGNAALAQMRGLPHTADYMSIDDEQKLEKLVKLIGEEMQERKSLLASANALNFTMYNTVSKKKLAAIVIVIDNYDVIRELGNELEEFWTRLTRDGAGIGIYVIASATRSNAFKYVVLNNFKQKVAHHLIDANDMTAIIGRTPYSLGEVPGRAFIKYANVNMMQIYTAVPYEDDIAYSKAIGALVEEIRAEYSGQTADGIRMMPETLDYEVLVSYAASTDRAMLPVGLDFEEIEVQYFSLINPVHLIIGTPQSGKTNLLRLVLKSLEQTAEKILISDSKDMDLHDFGDTENTFYCADAAKMADMLTMLKESVQERKGQFEQQTSLSPRQFYASLPTVCVVIDDFDNFIEMLKESKVPNAEALVRESLTVGICYIATSLSSRMKGFDELSKLFKEATSGLILGAPISQTIWQVSGIGGYKPRQDSALLYRKGELVPVKVPLMDAEKQMA